jgi:Coenzyme PQQ synthesis protein D (PqqD)
MQSYVRSTSVVSRVIAGETLIVPVRGGVGDLASIYSLNEVASSIWSAIAQPCSQDEIVERIGQEFSGERQQVEGDVNAFLAEMQSAGLVEAVGVLA